MKNKRPKSSIFNDSTKNKRRKQERVATFYHQKGKNHIKPNNQAFLNPNMRGENEVMSGFFSYSNKDANYKKIPTRHIISPLITDDGGPEPDYTYKMKSGLGSGHTYKRKEEKRTYLYGFTDSRFIYFLGKMEPRAYLIFVTLIALLILEDLNETEGKIIFAFISNVADSMQTVIEQEVILNSYNLKIFQREQGAALQKDFDTLYSQIDQLKREISYLKS